MSAFEARPAVFVGSPLQSFLFIIISLLTRFCRSDSHFSQFRCQLFEGLVSAKTAALNLFD